VNIIDRFLSARVVSLTKLQLVGITCLFVASKVEEIVAPSVSHFLHCADSSYTESDILLAERYVLKTVDWNLSFPNPMHFLQRVSKVDDYDLKSKTMGKYLLEVGTLE
jgi:G2/mitotic-specific cyclin 1/2